MEWVWAGRVTSCQRGPLLEEEKEREKSRGLRRTKKGGGSHVPTQQWGHIHGDIYILDRVEIKQVCRPQAPRHTTQLWTMTRPNGKASSQLITTSFECWNRVEKEPLKKISQKLGKSILHLAVFVVVCIYVCVGCVCVYMFVTDWLSGGVGLLCEADTQRDAVKSICVSVVCL